MIGRRTFLLFAATIALALQPFSILHAQAVSDGWVCLEPNLTNQEKSDFFASVSWEIDMNASDEVTMASMFLDNITETKTSSLEKTLSFAKTMSKAITTHNRVYRWHDSLVALGSYPEDNEYCIFVSPENLMDDLLERHPFLQPRTRGLYRNILTTEIGRRFHAAEFPASEHLSLPLPGNHSFAASVFTISN